jgi:PAS domain S-box-containing protein
VKRRASEREPPGAASARDEASRLRLLLGAITEYGLYLLDATGMITSWNPGAERITGFAAPDVVGRDFAALFSEEERQRGAPQAALDAARRDGSFETESWRLRKDGSRFRARSLIEPARDARGKVVGFVETLRDTAQRRAAQDALVDAERRFALLVGNVTDYAICMLDPSGIVINWNPGAEKIKGYRPDEIIGHHFSRFYTEEDRRNGEPERALLTAASEGRFEKEAWRVRKGGTRFWAHVVIDPIRGEDRTLLGFAKITRDVTERRRALEALEASERQLRLLIEGVVDYAIFMLDPNGIVTNWNTGAQRIKGYSATEIVGHHFSRFYTPEDRESGLPARALEHARQHGRFEAEGWRVRKDGSRFWASVVIDAVNEHGRLVGFAKITRDISERRRAQAALDAARDRLAQAQKMEAVGQLTGGVAHDFNNLLTVIGGRIEVMRRRIDDPALVAGVEAIERAVQRGQTLTRQLLAFSRRQALRPTVLDLRERLPRAFEMIRPSLRSDIELRVHVAPETWPVEVDANELELALLNLALNSRDALPAGGTLAITARNEVLNSGEGDVGPGEYVRIAVSDSGQGIPPEILPRVFEPFFTTKEVNHGTGLGLSQVYGFATQSGGVARISSRVGEGTTVILLLPRSHKKPAPEPVDVTAELDAEERASARILLVEDNEEVAQVTGIMLRSLGHEVEHVPDAKSALERIEETRFDLVISDVMMPGGISGIDLAARLAARTDAPPILLITGYSNAVREAAKSGLAILSKPFQIRALDLAIKEKLSARAAARS